VADDFLNTDLPAITGVGNTESSTREATPDPTRRRRIARKPGKDGNGLGEAAGEEKPQPESPEHEIDSFA
jgi:hypothetical protein